MKTSNSAVDAFLAKVRKCPVGTPPWARPSLLMGHAVVAMGLVAPLAVAMIVVALRSWLGR
jgi:hypothetical protein